jgi:WD40 repeat protein
VSERLSPDLAARVLSTHPLPIADAAAALIAADDLFEQRDRVVEVFRAVLRYLAALVLAARLQYGPGPGSESAQVPELLRALRSRGLTDGQWFALVREMLRPWSSSSGAHPIPGLVALIHGRKAELPKLIDELLLMRKSETVAHGASGTKAALLEILARRVPQLARVLELLDPLWAGARLLLPLALPEIEGEAQRAWLLMGDTPNRGLWQRAELGAGATLKPGECVIADASGKPVIALHPVVLIRRPSPEAVEEFFTLDGGSRKGAVYVALPSMAEHREAEAWASLERVLDDGQKKEAEGAGIAAGIERPFRGLSSFGPEHTALFFGREEQAEALANRIRREPLVTITGPSGSGKTSLLRAGALPQIEGITVAFLRPGADPLRSLAARIAEALGGFIDEADLYAKLDAEPAALGAVLARWGREKGGLLAIVVDQAEEALTLCPDEARRAAFAGALASAPGPSARVVISVREDFFGRLATLPALRGVYSRSVEVVSTPDREALARTLIAPARAFGYAFEDEALLVEMVDSVKDEPAALALLQFCADRLWDLRDRAWKRLSWDAYRAVGGVAGALASQADRAIAELTQAQRGVCKGIFLRLVTGERTRAVATKSELLEAAGRTEDAEAALTRLADARLVTISDASEAGDARVELVHEALIGHWAELGRWLAEDAEGQRLAHALRQAAQEWSARGRPRGLLWRGDVLEELRRWKKRSAPLLTGVEAAFAEASDAEDLRGRRIRRGLVAGALVTTSAFAVFMFVQWRSAVEAREEMRHARARAEVRGLIAQARVFEPEGRAGEALALFRAAARLQEDEEPGVADVSVDIERLARAGAAARVLAGHKAPVWRVAPSPDGSRIATGSIDGTAKIWDAATGACLHTLGDHGHIVEAITYSPDGRWIATGSGSLRAAEGTARLWDARSGELVRRLDGHTKPLLRVAFSSDGRLLVTASRDGSARLWDVSTGAAVRSFEHTSAVADIALSRDGSRLASSAGDDVFVWSASSGALLHTLQGHSQRVARVALSPDAATIASASADGTAILWDASSGARLHVLAASEQALRSLAFSPDGSLVATGSADATAVLWDTRAGTPVATLRRHGGPVTTIAWSPEGDRVATASDAAARVWDARTGALSALMAGHGDALHDLAFSSDGSSLITASADKTARLWDARRGPLRVFDGHGAEVSHVAFTSDGKRLATASKDGTARIWDLEIGAPLAILRGHRGPIQALAIAHGGARLATAARDGSARLWDLAGSRPAVELQGSKAGLTALAITADGRRVATAAADGAAHLWDGETGAALATLRGHDQALTAIAFSPDGRRVATASRDRTAKLWDTETFAELFTLSGHEGALTSIIYAHRGDRVATTSRHAARIWDTATGKELTSMTGHEQSVVAAAFSPDDAVLATASADKRLRAFRVASGELLRVLDGHTAALTAVAFSPDGERVASASLDGTARIWHAASGGLLDMLSAHAGPVATVAFSPSGDRAATGSSDGLAALWHVPATKSIAIPNTSGADGNLRVCRDTLEVVAVVPYPDPTLAWAPPDQCARAEHAPSAPRAPDP